MIARGSAPCGGADTGLMTHRIAPSLLCLFTFVLACEPAAREGSHDEPLVLPPLADDPDHCLLRQSDGRDHEELVTMGRDGTLQSVAGRDEGVAWSQSYVIEGDTLVVTSTYEDEPIDRTSYTLDDAGRLTSLVVELAREGGLAPYESTTLSYDDDGVASITLRRSEVKAWNDGPFFDELQRETRQADGSYLRDVLDECDEHGACATSDDDFFLSRRYVLGRDARGRFIGIAEADYTEDGDGTITWGTTPGPERRTFAYDDEERTFTMAAVLDERAVVTFDENERLTHYAWDIGNDCVFRGDVEHHDGGDRTETYHDECNGDDTTQVREVTRQIVYRQDGAIVDETCEGMVPHLGAFTDVAFVAERSIAVRHLLCNVDGSPCFDG